MTDQRSIDSAAEVARVQREIALFRDEFLPAVFDGPTTDFHSSGMSDRLKDHITATAGGLSDWRGAASRLSDLLPLAPLAAGDAQLDREPFQRFLFQRATPGYVVRGGRILWRVELFVSLEMGLHCPVFGRQLPGEGEDPWDWLAARADGARAWLTALPVNTDTLANSLCILLPFLADLDPPFARLCLDRETWRVATVADRTRSDDERAKRLRFCGGYPFGQILNNALLHVLGMLANNHFLSIRKDLEHPHLRGGYTHLMPHYLFAVLVEKVAALRTMAATPL
ncbi:MAG: hypothetical protein ACKODX_12000 [Gemmata sp.]